MSMGRKPENTVARLAIIIHIIILSPCFLQAQQKEIDSLQNLLNSSLSDTNRIIVLNNLANYHSQDDSGLYYARKGEELAKKAGYQRGEAEALFQMAAIYMDNFDVINGTPLIQKSHEIFATINDEAGIMKSLEILADFYYYQNDFRQELEVHLKAEQIARKYNLRGWLPPILGNIGKNLC